MSGARLRKIMLAWGRVFRLDMRDCAKTAQRYRLYAQELRAIADDDEIAATAPKLRSIADDYDRMAASMDAVGKSLEILKRI